jgi:hypothetical protein
MELLKALVIDRFTDELVGIGATALTLYVSDISSLTTPTSGFPGSNPPVAALSIGPASLDTVKLANVKSLNSYFLHRNFWAWGSQCYHLFILFCKQVTRSLLNSLTTIPDKVFLQNVEPLSEREEAPKRCVFLSSAWLHHFILQIELSKHHFSFAALCKDFRSARCLHGVTRRFLHHFSCPTTSLHFCH